MELMKMSCEETRKLLAIWRRCAHASRRGFDCRVGGDFDYTRNMENALDGIAAGKQTYNAVVSAAYQQLQREVSTMSATIAPAIPDPKPPLPHLRQADKAYVGQKQGNRQGFWSYGLPGMQGHGQRNARQKALPEVRQGYAEAFRHKSEDREEICLHWLFRLSRL